MTRCRYVGAHMHESGIKFESAIDISHYVRVCEDRAAKDESASAAPASESQRAIALAKELLELVQNGASPPLVTTILDGIRAIYAPTPAPTAETEPPASELAA
jgi:hypothetical protein